MRGEGRLQSEQLREWPAERRSLSVEPRWVLGSDTLQAEPGEGQREGRGGGGRRRVSGREQPERWSWVSDLELQFSKFFKKFLIYHNITALTTHTTAFFVCLFVEGTFFLLLVIPIRTYRIESYHRII